MSTSTPPRAGTVVPRVSQRQWQREETIAAIERAALPLLLHNGYEATTAEHLADAAGVSVRTLFRYFPSGKDDVIVAELRRSLDAFEAAVRARPRTETLIEALEAARKTEIARAGAAAMEDSSRLTSGIVRHQPALLARLLGERQLFAERMVDEFAARLGLDRFDDVRPRLLAHCYVAATLTAYFADLEHGGQSSARAEAAMAALRPLLTSI
jgi:AcrR family transcriptional regulator